MLESLGRDLCRTLLIYAQIYVPPELRNMFKMKPQKPEGSKTFSEDDDKETNAMDFKALIINELKENKQLLKIGDGNSSSGSDSAPSEDNLPPTEILKALPVADKALK